MIANPTNEHREQARSIAKRYTREGTGYADRLYQLAYAIEQALSSRDTEVREVLEGLAIRRHIDHKSWCWCQKRWDATKPHNENCQRARALYAKLQPLPSENPDPKVRE